MSYTLKFSDPSKSQTITVPDFPPGINAIDTSLSLVGKGYPNYGQKVSENFLHLLENFAGPYPPENAIEGQLWFDTSNPQNKVLRINNGTANQNSWPLANGIYQQGLDPRNTQVTGLKSGDIWVDTINNQLKIYSSGDWITIGPSVSQGAIRNGPEVDYIQDNTNTPTSHYVIKFWVSDRALSIFSFDEFTPRIAIEGYTSLVRGMNLYSGSILNGVAKTAQNLQISNQTIPSTSFLRKDDSSSGQVITGRVIWRTPVDSTGAQNGAQGRDGVVILKNNDASLDYIQFFKSSNNAVILNNTAGGSVVLSAKSLNSSNSSPVLTVNPATLANPASVVVSGSLEVLNFARIQNTLTVLTTASTAVSIAGGVSVAKNLNVAGNMFVSATSTFVGLTTLGNVTPIANNTYDIGSLTNNFNHIYAQRVGTTATIYYGTLNGNAQGLAQSTIFSLQGQVSAPSFNFSGTGTAATFTATLTANAITDQVTTSSVTSTAMLLVSENTQLKKVSKANFLADVLGPGMIMAYGGNINELLPNRGAPLGWLWCDGTAYNVPTNSTQPYWDLFQVIQFRYTPGIGTTFNVPGLMNSTQSLVSSSSTYIQYIIKI